jgi:hypothetical protein
MYARIIGHRPFRKSPHPDRNAHVRDPAAAMRARQKEAKQRVRARMHKYRRTIEAVGKA